MLWFMNIEKVSPHPESPGKRDSLGTPWPRSYNLDDPVKCYVWCNIITLKWYCGFRRCTVYCRFWAYDHWSSTLKKMLIGDTVHIRDMHKIQSYQTDWFRFFNEDHYDVTVWWYHRSLKYLKNAVDIHKCFSTSLMGTTRTRVIETFQ